MASEREFLKGCSETIVLTLLAERRMYGYELVQEIARRSGGVFKFPQGTVYPLLYALERKGLVRGAWDPSAKRGARRRKYYALTPEGRRAGCRDVVRWDSLVRGMNHVLRSRHASSLESIPG